METPGKQLMDFIKCEGLMVGRYGIPTAGQYPVICEWSHPDEAEAKINEFLQEQKNICEHAKELNEAPKGAKCRRCGTEEIPLKRRIDMNDMGAIYYLCWRCYRENPREDWTPKS